MNWWDERWKRRRNMEAKTERKREQIMKQPRWDRWISTKNKLSNNKMLQKDLTLNKHRDSTLHLVAVLYFPFSQIGVQFRYSAWKLEHRLHWNYSFAFLSWFYTPWPISIWKLVHYFRLKFTFDILIDDFEIVYVGVTLYILKTHVIYVLNSILSLFCCSHFLAEPVTNHKPSQSAKRTINVSSTKIRGPHVKHAV